MFLDYQGIQTNPTITAKVSSQESTQDGIATSEGGMATSLYLCGIVCTKSIMKS